MSWKEDAIALFEAVVNLVVFAASRSEAHQQIEQQDWIAPEFRNLRSATRGKVVPLHPRLYGATISEVQNLGVVPMLENDGDDLTAQTMSQWAAAAYVEMEADTREAAGAFMLGAPWFVERDGIKLIHVSAVLPKNGTAVVLR